MICFSENKDKYMQTFARILLFFFAYFPPVFFIILSFFPRIFSFTFARRKKKGFVVGSLRPGETKVSPLGNLFLFEKITKGFPLISFSSFLFRIPESFFLLFLIVSFCLGFFFLKEKAHSGHQLFLGIERHTVSFD